MAPTNLRTFAAGRRRAPGPERSRDGRACRLQLRRNCEHRPWLPPAPPAHGVTLITKTATNPFFVAMAAGAEEKATELGMKLTTAAGTEDGDTATQITAIENAISRGRQGHPHHPGRSRRQPGHREGARRGPVRHRPRHASRSGRHRRHHLRHGQLRGRQAHRRVDRRHARRRPGRHRPARPLR